MDLSVIIVSWNVRDKLKENLPRLFLSETSASFEVFVVDNNSSDGTAEMVAREFPRVKLLANSENFGFAKANNQAVSQATGKYILFLNPDMRVFPDTLEKAARRLKANPQAALAGGKLLDKEGKILKHIRKFPVLFDQLAIILKLPHIFPGILKKYLADSFDYSQDQEAKTVRGSLMFFDRARLEKFLPAERAARGEIFDERFFVWFEDVDLCRTIKEAGGQVWYFPEVLATDEVGASFSQLPRINAQKYFRDSMIKYFKKWQPSWQVWILWLAWPAGFLLTYIFTALKFEKRDNT
jgi:N-acetylglucosaminyl-diphospho-decaprenol L-rhamnosyltransferase